MYMYTLAAESWAQRSHVHHLKISKFRAIVFLHGKFSSKRTFENLYIHLWYYVSAHASGEGRACVCISDCKIMKTWCLKYIYLYIYLRYYVSTRSSGVHEWMHNIIPQMDIPSTEGRRALRRHVWETRVLQDGADVVWVGEWFCTLVYKGVVVLHLSVEQRIERAKRKRGVVGAHLCHKHTQITQNDGASQPLVSMGGLQLLGSLIL